MSATEPGSGTAAAEVATKPPMVQRRVGAGGRQGIPLIHVNIHIRAAEAETLQQVTETARRTDDRDERRVHPIDKKGKGGEEGVGCAIAIGIQGDSSIDVAPAPGTAGLCPSWKRQ